MNRGAEKRRPARGGVERKCGRLQPRQVTQSLRDRPAVVNPHHGAEEDAGAARDRLREEWTYFEAIHVPTPNVFAEARRYADDEALLRLIRRLAFEGKLVGYSEDNLFARLAKLLAQAEVA